MPPPAEAGSAAERALDFARGLGVATLPRPPVLANPSLMQSRQRQTRLHGDAQGNRVPAARQPAADVGQILPGANERPRVGGPVMVQPRAARLAGGVGRRAGRDARAVYHEVAVLPARGDVLLADHGCSPGLLPAAFGPVVRDLYR